MSTVRVGLTYDLKEDRIPTQAYDDTFAEFDTRETVEALISALEKRGYDAVPIGNARQLLERLPCLNIDIIFNIAEGGLRGRCREAYVPALLEVYNIPYVGSGPSTQALCLDKLMTKKIVSSQGIRTPGIKRFPCIVKPRYEGSAKGINRSSLVSNLYELKNRLQYIERTYEQPGLAEEFIEGWEFTVAVIGNTPPQAFPPLQRAVDKITGLSSHILNKDEASEVREFQDPLEFDKGLEERLKSDALAAYISLGCRDFARVDFRVNFKGEAYLLELNPLPSLARNDSFAILAECLNISYEDIIDKILTEALRRYDLTAAIMI